MDVVRHELGFSKTGEAFPAQGHLPRHLLAPGEHAAPPRRYARRASSPGAPNGKQELTRLYRAYVERKLANQALDYDDLLLYWHAMVPEPRSPRR